MEQLATVDRRVQPDQVYLVVDAMTGQDAVNSAKVFNDALELDGVIMTKLDGTARGGRYLSEGLDVYAYFNNDAQGYAIRNALDLKRYVEGA